MIHELIDISSVQQPARINWDKVKASGVRGVWVQCTRYSSQVEKDFARTWIAAQNAGLAVGAYHFAWLNGDPIQQANFFHEVSGGIGQWPGDLPPILDWEYLNPKTPLPAEACVQWAEAFMLEATKLWYGTMANPPRLPLLYTYPWFAAERQPALANSPILGQFPLHLAAYGLNQTEYKGTPKAPKPWDRVSVHQYIGNGGKVPGVPGDCDRNRMDCSEEEFRAFLGLR